MSAVPPDTKACPKCAMAIPRAAKFCPHCRKRLGTHPVTIGCAVVLVGFAALWAIGTAMTPAGAPRPSSSPAAIVAPTPDTAWLASPAGKLCAKHPGWDREACDAIAGKKIFVGMTAEQVIAAWGKPYKINSTLTGNSKHEQWVMHEHGSSYVYFEDGVMTALQQSK